MRQTATIDDFQQVLDLRISDAIRRIGKATAQVQANAAASGNLGNSRLPLLYLEPTEAIWRDLVDALSDEVPKFERIGLSRNVTIPVLRTALHSALHGVRHASKIDPPKGSLRHAKPSAHIDTEWLRLTQYPDVICRQLEIGTVAGGESMSGLWRSMVKAEPVRIISPDGSERCTVMGYFAGDVVFVDDMNADMEPGDELRRVLPNGKDDVYRIDDPLFQAAVLGEPDHYQVKVSRKGSFSHNTGGHMINVSGPNARVNLNSTDNSTNIVTGDVFGEMRQAIQRGVSNGDQRKVILDAINDAEQAQGTGRFLQAYQKVVSVAADHVGLIAPYLPALTGLLMSAQ